jgi:hypothetical protein
VLASAGRLQSAGDRPTIETVRGSAGRHDAQFPRPGFTARPQLRRFIRQSNIVLVLIRLNFERFR